MKCISNVWDTVFKCLRYFNVFYLVFLVVNFSIFPPALYRSLHPREAVVSALRCSQAKVQLCPLQVGGQAGL